ncbi:hypothetical protein SISNIDRAFT_452709 [Sistotremastrum niveocremeum HHB9708]|uniref:SigF-like NTF2-like domain-containing protein n=2 Tax=Sistotremastraceae TaxID=3402574 RepID=A0A164WSL3_9AGAM|nr:hypothetical protein SISNIDRAFT_452709 [Sistotremastrum niveocremeum HHB9708]KZT38400.1 hypothetical protein SISSUDRAFT_1047088 [Sistotremastrum suecicum HHB10207 ss-3]
MSPELGLEVDDFVYDKDKLKVFLNITQTFHIFLSPFKPASCRLVVQLTLEQLDGRYFIAHQNDFYNPQDFINLIIPPLSIFIFIALRFGAIASNINALLFQVLGLWRPKYK